MCDEASFDLEMLEVTSEQSGAMDIEEKKTIVSTLQAIKGGAIDVYLNHGRISDAGATVLSAAVKHSRTVQKLDLDSN